jgi:hypothetical protein
MMLKVRLTRRAVGMHLARAAEAQRRVVDRREPGEHQRPGHQADIADGDVIPLPVAEQVDDDAREPAATT